MVSLGNASSLSRVSFQSLSQLSLFRVSAESPQCISLAQQDLVYPNHLTLQTRTSQVLQIKLRFQIEIFNVLQARRIFRKLSKLRQFHITKRKSSELKTPICVEGLFTRKQFTCHLSNYETPLDLNFESVRFSSANLQIGNFRCFCLEPKTNRICYIFAKSINSRLGAVRDKWRL